MLSVAARVRSGYKSNIEVNEYEIGLQYSPFSSAYVCRVTQSLCMMRIAVDSSKHPRHRFLNAKSTQHTGGSIFAPQ